MTTKNKVDNSSPWKYSPNNSSDAYFGQGASMRAMIGQLNGEETDNGKLIINNLGSSFSHILFKNGNTILGDLYLNGTSLVLGNRRGNNPIGNENINIGHDNWPAGTITGSSNITIGDASMTSLTSGSHNIGLGTTLLAVTTGEHNIGIGDDSLTNITGNGNIAIGGNANPNTANASKTIAIGTNSVAGSIGAIAIGSNIESNESTETNAATARGGFSIAIGNGAISNYDNSINGLSIAIGTNAKANSEDDSGNAAIAIGIGAESNSSATIAIGSGANATGGRAIAIGDDARATGGRSIAIGPNNGSSYASDNDGSTMAAGENSIALGIGAYSVGTAGIAIGYNAEAKDEAIAIGKDTYILRLNGGIAIGAGARSGATDSNMSGDYAIAIGKNAKAGSDNGVSVGYNAGSSTKGYNNTAIGAGACQYVTGSYKTCIGANSGPSSGSTAASDFSKIVYLGDSETTVYIPGSLVVGGSTVLGKETNSITYIRGPKGNDNGSMTLYSGKRGGTDNTGCVWAEYQWENDIKTSFTNLTKIISDRRLKYVGTNNNDGLDKIKQLKIFNYTYKKDTTKTPHVGVIAQDLQKVFPNAVQKGKDGFLTIRMEDMFYAVINAIKELDAKYQAQEKRINELEKRIEKLEAKK